MSAPRLDMVSPHGRAIVVHAPLGDGDAAPCGAPPPDRDAIPLSHARLLRPLVMCLACALADGRLPGPRVRAPRDVLPELRREVGALFGEVRHYVVEWGSPSGAVLRSAATCGVSTADMRTQQEWMALRGLEGPRLDRRKVCGSCARRPPGQRDSARRRRSEP